MLITLSNKIEPFLCYKNKISGIHKFKDTDSEFEVILVSHRPLSPKWPQNVNTLYLQPEDIDKKLHFCNISRLFFGKTVGGK